MSVSYIVATVVSVVVMAALGAGLNLGIRALHRKGDKSGIL